MKIKARFIELHAGGFETKEDKENFDKFSNNMLKTFSGICAITPILDDSTGEMMSFVVDSPRADEILTNLKKGNEMNKN